MRTPLHKDGKNTSIGFSNEFNAICAGMNHIRISHCIWGGTLRNILSNHDTATASGKAVALRSVTLSVAEFAVNFTVG
jgi:hypothetical protein